MRLYCALALAVITGLVTPGKLCAQVAFFVAPDVKVSVKIADQKPVPEKVMVQLINVSGQLYAQTLVKDGVARFNQVPKDEYRVMVMAAGYESVEKRINLEKDIKLAQVDVELKPMSDVEAAASDKAVAALTPKAQKELGKALDALNKKRPADARKHLELAQQQAPKSAEVEYLLGMYATQMNDAAQAQAHWQKALEANPTHLSALVEVGQLLLNEGKSAEAMPYLNRAVEAEPSSWRAQALLAEGYYAQHDRQNAIKHLERAMELGHERAASLRPFYAGILSETGDKERALRILQDYVKGHPADAEAAKQLAELKNSPSGPPVDRVTTANELSAVASALTELPITSHWLPPDVDEKVPPVEPGAVCSVDEVVQKAGEQVVTLVHDFERFAATESLTDERISKWGVASSPEKRRFNYIASIKEIRPGYLSVDEYRNYRGKPAEFPNDIITNGLSSMALVFHPFYSGNFEMSCEGLARWNGALAWQVHFRQRPDKPIALRGFRMGQFGSLHPVALRGRAWILAENYQIARLETDLMRPVPEIRLVAEHMVIEYGSVNFRDRDVTLWLPQSAEVHFDWLGQRLHRRHSFNDYMLFAIDDNQRIGSPNTAKAGAINGKAGEGASLNGSSATQNK